MEYKFIVEQEPYELSSNKNNKYLHKAEKFLDLLPKLYGYEENNTGGIKMNNTEELELRVKNAQKELEEVTRLLEKSKRKTGEFVPKFGEVYWYIVSNGEFGCCYWLGLKEDNWRLLNNNCFRTREEAEEHKKKIEIQSEFERLAELSWRGEKIDWEDKNQYKWYLYYSIRNNLIDCSFDICIKDQGKKHFKTPESLEQAIEKIGEENIKKYVLEV